MIKWVKMNSFHIFKYLLYWFPELLFTNLQGSTCVQHLGIGWESSQFVVLCTILDDPKVIFGVI